MRQNARMSERPKRSRSRVLVLIVILIAAGAAVWWRQTATSDPKLVFTMFNRVNRVENDVTGNPAEGITRTINGNDTQFGIAFVPKQRIFVYLGLRNEGSRTVGIEEVPPAGFYYFGFDTMEVSPDPDADPVVTTYEPLKPFTLEPGERREVRLNFRLADCTPGDQQPGTTRINGLVVRYTILGLKRAWLVPFENSALTVPTIGRCEHPIVDPAGAPVPG